MRFLDEYRDPKAAQELARQIRAVTSRAWTIMEVCGGQTHTILKTGLTSLLPSEITLVHGPGCPVCVTPIEQIDKAVEIALRPEVIFTSYGDMLRVPGSVKSLFDAKAEGADVRLLYSPLDAVRLARAHPSRQIVFFAVGFETTAPAHALAILQAEALRLRNFSMLVSHVLVPPALEAILTSPDCRVQGFLAPGHVCTVMGYADYEALADRYRTPIVVAGFEPVDLLEGIRRLVIRLERGSYGVENAYARAVRREGNPEARRSIERVFEVTHRQWRGIGEIPNSGLRLRPEYAGFDAEQRFDAAAIERTESPLCIGGLVLQGRKKPNECSAFGRECTPERPLGAPMVSSEGACAAYYRYARHVHTELPPAGAAS